VIDLVLKLFTELVGSEPMLIWMYV